MNRWPQGRPELRPGRLTVLQVQRLSWAPGSRVSPLAVAAFRRGELRLAAELQWHEEFESKLADRPGSADGPGA